MRKFTYDLFPHRRISRRVKSERHGVGARKSLQKKAGASTHNSDNPVFKDRPERPAPGGYGFLFPEMDEGRDKARG